MALDLNQWKSEGSLPDNLTENPNLKRAGESYVSDSQQEKNILGGSAIGTSNKGYLDVIPFLNKIGEAYTNIINTNYNDIARSDAICTDNSYLDYTNGSQHPTNYSEKSDAILKLLMPQYKRRVEVEDLNKNFWVLGNVLDAAAHALWGTNGIVEVIRNLIDDIINLKTLLGNTTVKNIELCHEGSNDLYFDMYSRFNLNGLSLKLKSDIGEREIKNIFTQHDQDNDRAGSTYIYDSAGALFQGIQGAINLYETLYDSDIITGYSHDRKYISLGTIIDVLNDRLSNNSSAFQYRYLGNSVTTTFFKLLDVTPNDGAINVVDIENLEKNLNKKVDSNSGKTITVNDLARFEKYATAKEQIKEIGNQVESNDHVTDEMIDFYSQLKMQAINQGYAYGSFTPEQLSNFYFDETYVQVESTNVETLNKVQLQKRTIIIQELQRNGFLNTYYSGIFYDANNNQVRNITDIEYSMRNNKMIQLSYSPEATYISNDSTEDTAVKEEIISKIYTLFDTFEKDEQEITTIKKGLTLVYKKINNYLQAWLSIDEDLINDKIKQGCTQIFLGDYPSGDGIFSLDLDKNYYCYTVGMAALLARLSAARGTATYEDHIARTMYNANYASCTTNQKSIIDNVIEFFDFNGDNDLNVRDASQLANTLAKVQKLDSQSNKRVVLHATEMVNKLKSSDYNQISGQYYSENLKPFFNAIKANRFYLANNDVNAFIKLAFTPISLDNGTLKEKVNLTTIVTTPSQNLINFINKQANEKSVSLGESLNSTQDGLGVIEETEFSLSEKVLIVLYDKSYYQYYNQNLYVRSSSQFFDTSVPILPTDSLNSHNCYVLFVPRIELRGGELVQLGFCPKERTDSFWVYNFSNFSNGQIGIKQLSDSNPIFLSLSNSFATVPSQYNYRTTLFFKDTVPKLFTSATIQGSSSLPFKKVNDWFRNGIYCSYFKPEVKSLNGQLIMSPTNIEKNLILKASMICSKNKYNDQSFVEQKIDSRIDTKNLVITSQNKTENTLSEQQRAMCSLFSFIKTQAYGAAQRNNLLFYCSPALKDGEAFIHSPLQMLLSPSSREDESIQPPRWKGPITDINFPAIPYVYNSNTSKQEATIGNIHECLFKNSLSIMNTRLTIEALWGRRDVENYIKKKQLRFILIQRDPGSRHVTSSPTDISVRTCDGFISKRIAINQTVTLRTTWFDSNGNKINFASDGAPPSNASYGIAEIPSNWSLPSSAFDVTFSCTRIDNNQVTYTISQGYETVGLRPVFKAVYFFGTSVDGNYVSEDPDDAYR